MRIGPRTIRKWQRLSSSDIILNGQIALRGMSTGGLNWICRRIKPRQIESILRKFLRKKSSAASNIKHSLSGLRCTLCSSVPPRIAIWELKKESSNSAAIARHSNRSCSIWYCADHRPTAWWTRISWRVIGIIFSVHWNCWAPASVQLIENLCVRFS